MPVINHMRVHLRRADRIFVDETRAPVLEPGLKRAKSGYFWAVVSDNRGHGSTGPPIVVQAFLRTGGSHALTPLRPRSGQGTSAEVPGRVSGSVALQCDAYQSGNALTEIARDNFPWQLVYCWTHVRRRLKKQFESDGSPIAEEMLRQIALLYQVEKSVRGKEAAVRRRPGMNMQARSLPRCSHGWKPSSCASRRNPCSPRISATPLHTGPV